MKPKQIYVKATLLIGAAMTLVFAGCGLPGAPSGTDNGAVRATNYYQCWVGGNGGGVNCTCEMLTR